MTTTSTDASSGNTVENHFEDCAADLAASVSEWKPATPRQLVSDLDLCKLYVYPSDSSEHKGNDENQLDEADVILIIYAMVNTASILDLGHKISTIERLKEQGLTVYLMEWKAPQSGQSSIGLGDYLDQSLHRCVQKVRRDCQLDKVNLMGVCQGGVFSLCYASLYPEYIRSIVPVVTPVNFHTKDDTLSNLARYLNLEILIQPGMNIPGQLLAQVFLSLKPMALTIKKYMDIAERLAATENNIELTKTFMAMEQWIEETPDQPAQVFKEFVNLFYQQNAFYKSTLSLSDVAIDLRELQIPVLNVHASNDHLVPPESSKALGSLVHEKYYQSLEVETGHIGIFVSKKALKRVPSAIAEFIRQV